jgi:5-methylthioadenosine/S-adenosylhomocysteine deaminase
MGKPRRRWYPLTGISAQSDRSRAVPAEVGVPRAAAPPIDPLEGPRLALRGRIVTMDAADTVITDGVLYIDQGLLNAVQPAKAKPPVGFENIKPIACGGTIYPGLIELHNHLAYNALPMWSPVPKKFEHRGQWPDHPDYRRLISGPMTVIGEHRDEQGKAALLPPLVRYVECKALLGGVTTSQGIMLNSNAGIRRYYRGLLRNVENTADVELPNADARIADIDAKDAASFWGRLKKEDSCFLLHLSEGVTPNGQTASMARKHFLALEVAPGEWAINDRLACIHAAGLLPEDFDRLAQRGGSIIWSPLSNLLLYGDTARIADAKKAGVRIGLGSDWSPSGSKNLLGEMKVAWLYAQNHVQGVITAKDIVAMATRDGAAILKWSKALGSLEAGKRADIVVVYGKTGDPYEHLIKARETAIRLVMVNGVPRYGLPSLMKTLGASGENIRVGGNPRTLFLEQRTADPDVATVSLTQARSDLQQALQNIRELAAQAEAPQPRSRSLALDSPREPVWTLALDEIQATGVDIRPRLPYGGPRDFTGPSSVATRAPSAPLSQLLGPIQLDPLTVADDANFLTEIEQQLNLPDSIRQGLRSLY